MNIHVIPAGPECQPSWYAFVYSVGFREKEAFPVFGKGEGGRIAEEGREKEEGRVSAAGAIG